MSDTFLYAINQPNKLSETNESGKDLTEISAEFVPQLNDIEKLQALMAKIPRLNTLIPPKEIESHEMVYVTELLAAYADAEQIKKFTKESIAQYPKYQRNFARQRKDYYAAESIRRGARDAFGDSDPDHFEVLKTETYDGIIDVHSRNYPNGYERLNQVMVQAAIIQVNKCLLSTLPDWVGNSEKKGVCHVLVNDGRIKWVDSDD